MPVIFVFGTLKRGFPLHDPWLSHASYLGAARTVHPHPMLIAGPRFAPMMLHEPGRGLRVHGELYGVSDVMLADLDALESVGTSASFRAGIEVLRFKDGPHVKADAFFKSAAMAKPAHSAFLETYEEDLRFRAPKLYSAS
jgi:gamma-glutamylaminecyclotransferase